MTFSPTVAAIGSSAQLDGGQYLISSSKTLFLDNIMLFEWKNNVAVLGNLKHHIWMKEKTYAEASV